MSLWIKTLERLQGGCVPSPWQQRIEKAGNGLEQRVKAARLDDAQPLIEGVENSSQDFWAEMSFETAERGSAKGCNRVITLGKHVGQELATCSRNAAFQALQLFITEFSFGCIIES